MSFIHNDASSAMMLAVSSVLPSSKLIGVVVLFIDRNAPCSDDQ